MHGKRRKACIIGRYCGMMCRDCERRGCGLADVVVWQMSNIVTFGFQRNPDVAGNGRSEGRKRVWPIAIDYRTVAGTARVGCKGDRRSKGPDSRSPERTPMALRRHKGRET